MGINIEFEVIAKYNGDILNIEKELDVYIEILGYNYAIISLKSYDEIDKLLEYQEIEYIEKPFILQTQDKQSFSSTGISKFKNKTELTGKGTILGIIDSGIDYNLPVFKDKNGDTKILYYWDQTSSGNPPKGFKKGNLYSKDDINKAIKGEGNIPIVSNSTHGTHVAGICSEIANEANLIVVKIGNYNTDYYSKSTEFMRAIKFILDKSLELKMPVAINISYGSNEGSHKGLSLFEEYIDEMASYWKNNIIVASGNNRDKGGHVFINIKDKMENIEVEFVVSENEKIININIWPDFIDEFSVYLVNPSNLKSQPISIISKEIKNILGRTKVKGYFYSTGTYSLVRRITFQLTSDISINPGIWKIIFIPINIVTGDIDIYLPTSEGINKDTRFLVPDKELTVTVPGTCKKVITVGSYNSRSDTVSIFSGEGDIDKNIYKPDILAPGENIVSYLPGGSIGALSGTSMATPHVTGVCSLILEWGVVRGRDKFLYSQKLKSLLLKNARRYDETIYPNNSMGYGILDLSSVNLETLLSERDEKSLYRKHRKTKKIKRDNDLEVIYDDLIPRIGIVHKIGFEEKLKKLNNGYHIYRISYNLVIIYQERDYIYDINEILNLNLVERTMDLEKVALLGKINLGINEGVVATEDIGASFFKDTPNISVNGTGVLIGIPDSGIDYLHEDFIYPDGTSKIAYLWDQTKDGKPPIGYFIGSEYNNEEINNAIKNSDATLSKDEEGHGTMMSSICAGLGNKEKEYAGIAEGSELIVVKMEKINGNYDSIHLYAAIEYIYRKSKELNKPLVINISSGSNFMISLNSLQVGLEDGRLNTYFKQGVCIVTGVGNEGNTQTHTSGKIDKVGEYVDIELEVSDLEDALEIQILTSKPDKMIVTVITPTGEESKLLEVSSYTTISGLFDLEGTKYTIKYIYPTANQGQQETRVILENVKLGIWKVRLYGEYITNGIYHLFLPNKVFLKPGTRLTKSNPYNTINSPANYNETIAVGAYDTINNSLWSNSSRGYTLTGVKKPDIVAPGVNIIASYPGNNYATITGTSVASAHVSGAIALYLQYTLVDGNYKNRSYVQQIKTYLKSGAKRKDDTMYPNKDSGYGMLDVKGMFIQLR